MTDTDTTVDIDQEIDARIAAALAAHVDTYDHVGDIDLDAHIDLDALAEKVAERLDLDGGGDTSGGWGASAFGDGPFGVTA